MGIPSGVSQGNISGVPPEIPSYFFSGIFSGVPLGITLGVPPGKPSEGTPGILTGLPPGHSTLVEQRQDFIYFIYLHLQTVN